MPIRPIQPIEVNLGFDLLEKHLSNCEVSAGDGHSMVSGVSTKRRAAANEFMLMHVEDADALSGFLSERVAGRRYGFKHIVSRNYLFIESAGIGSGWAGTSLMIIPANDAPFMRGEFPAPPRFDQVDACTTAPAEVSA
jgi:hypothetical protein